MHAYVYNVSILKYAMTVESQVHIYKVPSLPYTQQTTGSYAI